jgi:hypothetical protein
MSEQVPALCLDEAYKRLRTWTKSLLYEVEHRLEEIQHINPEAQSIRNLPGRFPSEDVVSQAFDAIHDTAVKILPKRAPAGIEQGLNLIVSLARYKYDVRSE